ncbi:MAG: MerR family DNA-binding transcriptional regulator [Chloroflexota bacterium]|nr:MerR family DNA-binding transcriptional regulator [Chloroflexota bacterium]
MQQTTPRLLTISQAAAQLGVHPDTLRAWADKGLVPVVRTPTGYRRFDPEEIDRLRAEMGLEGKALAA